MCWVKKFEKRKTEQRKREKGNSLNLVHRHPAASWVFLLHTTTVTQLCPESSCCPPWTHSGSTVTCVFYLAWCCLVQWQGRPQTAGSSLVQLLLYGVYNYCTARKTTQRNTKTRILVRHVIKRIFKTKKCKSGLNLIEYPWTPLGLLPQGNWIEVRITQCSIGFSD